MDIEQEARAMHWVPKEEFKGNEADWVDAETFVEKGRQIMPILRENNKRLIGEVTAKTAEIDNVKAQLTELQESVEAMKAFHEESTKAQVEKARRDILANLKEAKVNGDVDGEMEQTSILSQFDAAQRTVTTVKPTQTVSTQAATQLDPDVKQWMSENPWYGVDHERSGFMDGIARRLRAESSPLTGRAFLEAAAQAVEERLGAAQGRPVSKVEGGRGGGTARSGGTDYASLPAEARAQCDKQAAKFVGANKAFKDVKSWNAYYASEYHKGN